MNELIITTTLGAGGEGRGAPPPAPAWSCPWPGFPEQGAWIWLRVTKARWLGQVVRMGGDAGDIWLLRDQLCVLWSRTRVCPLLPSMRSYVQDRLPPGSKSSSVQGYLLIPGLCWSGLWKISPQLRAGGHAVAIIC